jgi:hypothetical protein
MLRSGAGGALERVPPSGGGLPFRTPSPSALAARTCYAFRRSISSSLRTLGRRMA